MASEAKRRGRPPKAEADLRRNGITFRCADDLWDQLRVAAVESGRSINKEMEERLCKSFVEDEINLPVLKMLVGTSNPIATIFDIAVLWDRSKTTANRKVRSSDKWYNDQDKIMILEDYFKSNFRRFLLHIAARERMEDTTAPSGPTEPGDT